MDDTKWKTRTIQIWIIIAHFGHYIKNFAIFIQKYHVSKMWPAEPKPTISAKMFPLKMYGSVMG